MTGVNLICRCHCQSVKRDIDFGSFPQLEVTAVWPEGNLQRTLGNLEKRRGREVRGKPSRTPRFRCAQQLQASLAQQLWQPLAKARGGQRVPKVRCRPRDPSRAPLVSESNSLKRSAWLPQGRKKHTFPLSQPRDAPSSTGPAQRPAPPPPRFAAPKGDRVARAPWTELPGRGGWAPLPRAPLWGICTVRFGMGPFAAPPG